jgi:hypothetical protein
VCTAAVDRICRSKRTAVGSHRRSPRANASEDAVHLENEALTVEDLKGHRWEEEGS